MSRAFRLSVAAITFLVALSTRPAHAGWTLPEGESQFITRFELYSTDESFNLDGDTVPLSADGDYRKNSLAAYAEYGLRDTWMLFVNLPLEYARYEDDTGFESSGTSLGDAEFGVRHRLSRDDVRYAISWQVSAKVPLYSDTQDPQPGNHQLDIDVRLPLGYGFGSADRGGYVTALPGVRWRAGEPTDEARLDIAFGWRPGPRWLLELAAFGLWSLEEGNEAPPPTTSPGNGIDFDRTRVQVQAVFWMKPGVGLLLGGYRDIDGRNVGRGDAAYAGMWMRF